MSADADKPVILLVDDTPANIHIAQSILKDEYRIRVATSGAKALELVKTKPVPALILLDVEMPEMDGYEVCRRLKADAQTRDIPVIFLTGKTETESETRGFEVGAVDYVHKPFSPPVVKARVRTHLALRAVSEQLAEQLLTINNELEMAREIQLAILPRETPKLAGLEIAARYLPMSTVAGDFYDFIILDDKHVGVLIADVSGHGLPAALIASMLQVSLTAQLTHASEPGRVLAGLNRALCGKFRNHFVTAAYLFVDMEKNCISYAGAAHPPLLLWRASTGSASEVLQNGLLFGPFSERNLRRVARAGRTGRQGRPLYGRYPGRQPPVGGDVWTRPLQAIFGIEPSSRSGAVRRFAAGGIVALVWISPGGRPAGRYNSIIHRV